MKMTFISVSSPAIQCMIRAEEAVNTLVPDALELKIYYAVSEYAAKKNKRLTDDIAESDFVFVDLMGSPVSTIKAVCDGLEKCSGNIVPYGNSARQYLRLGAFTAASMQSKNPDKKPDMAAMKKMQNMAEAMGKVMPGKMRDMKNYSQLCKYFFVADTENIYNMLLLILRDYGGVKNLPKPREAREVPEVVLCDPETMRYFETSGEFMEAFPYDKDKPVVALLFYGHIYPMDYSKAMSVIHKKLLEFANVIPVAVGGTAALESSKVNTLVLNTLPNKPDLIVNTMSFRLSAGPMGGNAEAGTSLLSEADAPYLHPMFMSRRTISEWKDSIQGSTPAEVLISVMLPEFDGALETIPVGAKSTPRYNEKYDVVTDEIEIIEERLNRLRDKAEKYIALSRKPVSDKKIAIICYNYPPGEANLFGGAFLDTFRSVENILAALTEHGYGTRTVSKEELMSNFTAGKLVNSGRYDSDDEIMLRYPLKQYLKTFDELAEKQLFIDTWGPPGGSIMTGEDGDFQIPAAVFGNVLVGLQPSRGVHEEQDKLYHDKTLPPHHQYVAFYSYLRDTFEADAVIHVGTHGTLEFLKGKECGMSGGCYPDMLIGDLPHLYLYYCGNPSEATIAKRRSHAQIISYQPPVFVPGRLYGDYAKLSALTDDYHHALAVSPASVRDVLGNIEKLAQELNLPEELDALEAELYQMNKSLIPKGLHAYGENYTADEAKAYIKGILRYSRNDVSSLRAIAAQADGADIETLEEQKDFKSAGKYDEEADAVFDAYFESGTLPAACREQYEATLRYGQCVYEKIIKNHELDGLIHALDGGYTPVKTAGDIYRNPDVLPTGTNLIQFDQRFVPSPTAYERGFKIAENTLRTYEEENGAYPESAAVILWGLETSRTQGETFSQILGYLGVKMNKKGNIWDPKFEVIPIGELGRPRIDVTVNICGFFRDMFPNLLDSLDDVLHHLYESDETDGENFFKAHAKKIFAMLIDEGYEEDEAEKLAVSRVFGPKEGEYGTGITSIIETKAWEKEEQIGSQFLTSLRYVYNRSFHGRDVDGLYESNLKSVDIVSQIRDNQEYEITDLDHYYEFFGGLSKSVEMVRGKKAAMYITDTTGDRVITETVDKAINRGIRTRVLNPKWIDGLLEHQYHGAQKIAERFENVMGLAATTGSVEQWIYNDLHSLYVEDPEMRRRMAENNAHAYMDILEQMMEYYNRGYWDATEDQIAEIKKAYLELEENLEEML